MLPRIRVQIGGGDQWGNISAGCDFVKRATGNTVHGKGLHTLLIQGVHVCIIIYTTALACYILGLTLPLLTNSAGEKFGKSMGNAVWLSAERTSCYELYQHFVGSPDQEVQTLLTSFTLLPLERVEGIMKEHSVREEQPALGIIIFVPIIFFTVVLLAEMP